MGKHAYIHALLMRVNVGAGTDRKDKTMRIFDLNPSHALGLAVAKNAGCPLSVAETVHFRGGQRKMRPLVSVRGEDVFLIAPLHGGVLPDGGPASVNDLLVQMLFFIATCRDHGAARVSAVIPWLPYARKDRRTKARDPVSARYIAQLIEAAGTDLVITADVHNPAAFQNGFRCNTVHLDTCKLFSAEVAGRADTAPLVILSPDCGGVKRAELLRQAVEVVRNQPVGFGFVEKHRASGVVTGTLFAGEVVDRDVWIFDDMIESGETMLRAAHACTERGAKSVHLLATHPFFDADFHTKLRDLGIASLTVTDTVPPHAPTQTTGVQDPLFRTLSVAPMIGQCLARIHDAQAISPILDPTGLSR